jgi:hypothetical protein
MQTTDQPSPPTGDTSAISWPVNPYKGLSFYTSVDSGLFGAREADVRACARIVGEEEVKVLLLHGTTGCGKSSFLRAGLIPHLESGVGRFQFLRTYDANDVKALFIRCTDAPLDRLCETLYDWSDAPFRFEAPDGDAAEISLMPIRGAASSREAFIQENSNSVDTLIDALRHVGRLLPKTMVLVIDQGEEILTLNPRNENEKSRKFFDFLIAFSKTSIDLKIVVALRKEYFGDFFEKLAKRRYDSKHITSFLLEDLTRDQLIDAILKPTLTNVSSKFLQGRPQPGIFYNFQFEDSLPETIAESLIGSRPRSSPLPVLPVLQITCERLYDKTNAARSGPFLPFWHMKRLIITHSDYIKLGKPDEQVDRYIHEKLSAAISQACPELSTEENEEEVILWKDVLYTMVQSQPDNTALTRICSEEELKEAAKACRADFKRVTRILAHPDNRLLRDDPRGTEGTVGRTITVGPVSPVGADSRQSSSWDEGTNRYFSLGHDAIAISLSKWGSTRKLELTQRSLVRRVSSLTERSNFGIIAVSSAIIASVISYVISGFQTYSSGALTYGYTFAGYYFFLTILALAAAGLLFGLLRSALFVGKRFGWPVILGGPAGLFVVVVMAGTWLIQKVETDFTLIIRLRTLDGTTMPAEFTEAAVTASSLTIDLGQVTIKRNLDRDGQVVLSDLPFRVRGSNAVISISSNTIAFKDPKGSYAIPADPEPVLTLIVIPKPRLKKQELVRAPKATRITSGGTSDGHSPFCQPRSATGCVEPQHGGNLVLGSGGVADLLQNSPTRASYKIVTNTPQQICVEFFASTGACETEIYIQGTVTAVEEFEVR